jgi:hypothetical protein
MLLHRASDLIEMLSGEPAVPWDAAGAGERRGRMTVAIHSLRETKQRISILLLDRRGG